MNEQRHIHLHLPNAWNRCTTDELEYIAAEIISEQLLVGRYHQFDWDKVKLKIVLAVNGISIVPSQNEEVRDGQEWLVKRTQDEEAWPINVGQLVSLCKQLSWLTDEKARPLFNFPYPKLIIGNVTLQGASPLLDGYSWNDYRLLSDWMQIYVRNNNARLDAGEAQRQFLAVLFRSSDGSPVNPNTFENFSPVKWQVILFWWSALMQQLAQKFPKVFKARPVKRGQRQESPWDFYNHVTATLADEYKTSEKDQRDETYSVTLQKLQNMADKAAEMERISKKK